MVLGNHPITSYVALSGTRLLLMRDPRLEVDITRHGAQEAMRARLVLGTLAFPHSVGGGYEIGSELLGR